MVETFMINQLMVKSKSMMKLKKLQQEKEMITQRKYDETKKL